MNWLRSPRTRHVTRLRRCLVIDVQNVYLARPGRGTNLRLMLTNLGIKTVICVGVFTDRCLSSTVRSLTDESFDVVLLEDCCGAGTDGLHARWKSST